MIHKLHSSYINNTEDCKAASVSGDQKNEGKKKEHRSRSAKEKKRENVRLEGDAARKV